MLAIDQKRRRVKSRSWIVSGISVAVLGVGAYLLLLVATPEIAPYVSPMKPLDAHAVAALKIDENRIIIPKIGVNIHYDTPEATLDRGALWRYPDRGDPEKGGNFILAAHRFSLAPTPQETFVKSPFYHIEKLVVGDEVVVDYNGVRYGYKINNVSTVTPDQTEVEATSDTPKLTLYTCTLGGASDGRVVMTAEPLGPVTMGENGMSVNKSS